MRVVLAPARVGALLLDLESGAVVELNDSAAFVWNLVTKGWDHASIGRELSARFGLDATTADSHVIAALSLPTEEVRPPPTDFNYRGTDEGYLFEHQQKPAFRIDRNGDEISLPPESSPSPEQLPALLHAVAPKLLSLRGHVVLHAGAVSIGNRVLAFSGVSGAGKSTTARAFRSAGGGPVCDDQLVIDATASSAHVGRRAEEAIDRWIASARDSLLTSGRADCTELDRVLQGERLDFAEIGFLDRTRRHGSGYRAEPLTPTGLAGMFFRNLFHGCAHDDYWRRILEVSVRLGSHVTGFLLTPPDTIESLKRIASDRVSAGTLTP